MVELSDQDFEKLVADAMDDLAEKVARNMDNVVVVWADDPTEAQRIKMKLRPYQTLFGLYEGVPKPVRGAGYNLVLPDKITVFKGPMMRAAHTMDELKRIVHNTVWHEIAHHFGLSHEQIEALEHKDDHRH